MSNTAWPPAKLIRPCFKAYVGDTSNLANSGEAKIRLVAHQLSDTTFIPPVHRSIRELMSYMEKFVHNDNQFFLKLIKITLMHYQVETIHPFLDGNGRFGRLLITLYLVNKAFSKNVLYLSHSFERNRTLYYDNLIRVRGKDDFLQWFKYFLTGVIETAKTSIDTFDKILQLQK